MLRMQRSAPLQSEIVRGAVGPAGQVFTRTPQLQVAEKRKKSFLQNVFAILARKSERHGIAQQPVLQFVVEGQHLGLQILDLRCAV